MERPRSKAFDASRSLTAPPISSAHKLTSAAFIGRLRAVEVTAFRVRARPCVSSRKLPRYRSCFIINGRHLVSPDAML
jgi:hypothetical protein